MEYSQYSELKNTGVHWLPEQPNHWEVKRLRFMLKVNPIKSEVAKLDKDTIVSFVPMEAVGENGGMNVGLIKVVSEVYTGYTYFREGDTVVAKITPCFENGKGAISRNLKNEIGFGTTEFHVLRAGEEIDEVFIFYLTLSHSFRKIGASEMLGAGGQKRIPEDYIKDFRLGIPPLKEQQKIAAFLDYKTQQIDRLIEKKKALIEKLEEKRIAVITQAVTKGLDKNAKLKPSGMDWLGDVPEHWKVGGLLKFINNRVDYRGKTPEKVPQGVFLITAKNIKNGIIDYDTSKEYVKEEAYEAIMSRGKPQLGDVLFTTEAPLGEVACVNNIEVALAQRIIKFQGEEELNNFFMKYWMMSNPFQDNLQSLATGSTAKGIKASKLFELRVVVPPVSEQNDIVNSIEKEIKKNQRVRRSVFDVIKALEEYRSAIITSAVTGKIDVREVEIPKAAV